MGGIIYYPMYHPAAALHQRKWLQVIEEDMAKIPQVLAEGDGIPDIEVPQDPKQLSLF
jgi:DNA polymerase